MCVQNLLPSCHTRHSLPAAHMPPPVVCVLTLQVYSHNTDKLVDREVAFSRGTGGATLLLHCVLDPTLAEAIASTYYFLDWRNFQPVSAMLLNQHDLLPEEAELDEVGRVLQAAPSGVL